MSNATLLTLLGLSLTACDTDDEAAPVEGGDDAAEGEGVAALEARLAALEAQQAADQAAVQARLDAASAREAALEAEVAGLSSEVAALEEGQLALEAALEESDAALAAAEGRIGELEAAGGGAAMARLAAVLSVDAAGDLTLDGVNLWLRSGGGATDATPNGKGNLILGYGEALGGEARTGSHSLVVGPYHAWTAAWGIVSGEFNGLYANGGALVGGKGNSVTHANAVDAGGAGVSSTYTCGFRGSGLQSGSGC